MYIKNKVNNTVSKISGVLGRNFYDQDGNLSDDYEILGQESIADQELKEQKEIHIKSRKSFLAESDYEIIKFLEEFIVQNYQDIPITVSDKIQSRARARDEINLIENIVSNEELNQYDQKFNDNLEVVLPPAEPVNGGN